MASTVAWLYSEECSTTTGAVFDLFGGRLNHLTVMRPIPKHSTDTKGDL
jgi:hypothetical protein